jgi:hypothetical protein
VVKKSFPSLFRVFFPTPKFIQFCPISELRPPASAFCSLLSTFCFSTLAVETVGLTRRFGELLAIDAIGLRVERSTFYGFLGSNGAGK